MVRGTFSFVVVFFADAFGDRYDSIGTSVGYTLVNILSAQLTK